MTDPPPAAVRWRRFHIAAVLFEAASALKELALPILVGLGSTLLGDGGISLGRGALVAVAAGLVTAALGLVRWSRTEWTVTPTDIRRRQGVLRREERRVPLARVQGLDGVRGPVQRLFGIVTLHVQTAGGGQGGEIVLTALREPEALALHDLVGTAAPLDPSGPLRRLRGRELLIGAATSGQVGLVVAIGAAITQLVPDSAFDPDHSAQDLDTLERLAPDSVLGWIEAAALVLGLFWLIAIAGSVVVFSGFTLMRDGERLRMRRGLLSVRESSVPVRRVQAVTIVEGLLRQPFGLCSLRVETLGSGDEPATNTTAFPLLRRREVEPLLREFLPELAADPGGLRRPPRRALRRYAQLPALAAALPGILAAVLVDGLGWWLPVVLALLGGALGAARWSAAGWRLDPDGRAITRERRLARHTLMFGIGRSQFAVVGQSLLQRRAGLADVTVDVGPVAGCVRHVEAITAWRLWQATRPAQPAPPGR